MNARIKCMQEIKGSLAEHCTAVRRSMLFSVTVGGFSVVADQCVMQSSLTMSWRFNVHSLMLCVLAIWDNSVLMYQVAILYLLFPHSTKHICSVARTGLASSTSLVPVKAEVLESSLPSADRPWMLTPLAARKLRQASMFSIWTGRHTHTQTHYKTLHNAFAFRFA